MTCRRVGLFRLSPHIPGMGGLSMRLNPHLLLWVFGLTLACKAPEPTGNALLVVDDAGDTTHLAAPARRIVSLIPATTEMLFALGAGNQVAGRTTWDDYPPEASRVPSVGDGISPNLEAVLGRQPDLVVMYRSASNSAAAARLQKLGIPVVQLAVDRLADVPRVLGLLGTLTGHEREADSVSAVFRAELAEVTITDTAGRPSVFILAWDQPPMTIGAGSFLSEVVERAGGHNAYADLPGSSAQISIESVVKRDPDMVLISTDNLPAFSTRPEWQTVPAVRDRRFVRVENSAFSRPSPRAPDAIRILSRLLRDSLP